MSLQDRAQSLRVVMAHSVAQCFRLAFEKDGQP